MVSIFTGAGMGLQRGSANILGGGGALGSADLGRANDGVYVNAASGNLIISNQDEFLIGQGPDAAISRTYNSQGTYSGDSDNWLQNSQRKIVLTGTANQAGSTATLTDWDGSEIIFSYGSGGYKSAAQPYNDDLLTLSGNEWTWTEGKSRTIQKFDKANGGRITSVADTDGNTVTYSYNGSGYLDKITTADNVAGGSPKNSFVTFAYTGSNLTSLVTSYYDTVSATNKTLTRTRYSYDGSSRLIKVSVDLSPEDNATSDGRVYETVYGYADATTSKRITSITQTDGTSLNLTYDGSGRVATFVQTVDGSTTRTTTFTYGSGSTTITDPQGNATVMQYNSSGQLTKLIEPAPVAGSNAVSTVYEYDTTGNLTRIRKFDAADSANSMLIPASYSSSSNYNGYTGLSSTGAGMRDGVYTGASSVHGNGYGAGNFISMDLGTITQVNAVTIASIIASFDGWGAGYVNNATLERSNDGVTWTNVATLSGIVDGTPSTFTVNASARYFRVTSNSSGWLGLGDFYATGSVTAIAKEFFLYDSNSNLLEYVDSSLHGTKWTYGSNNEVLTKTTYTDIDPDALGAVVPSGAMTTHYIYDAENHLRFTLSPEGRVTEYRYNTPGQLAATINYAGDLYTNTTYTETALNSWVSNTADKTKTQRTDTIYDFRGNIAQVTSWSQTDSAGYGSAIYDWSRTDYVYDQYGKLLQKVASGTNAQGAQFVPTTETYAYDGMGRAVRFTDAKGVGTWTSYIDAQARTVTTLASGLTTTSIYNRAGELISTSEARNPSAQIGSVSDINQWATNVGTLSDVGTLDGAPARQVTVQHGGQLVGSPQFAPVAGSTYTFTISLQAVGSASSVSLGLFSSTDNWGADTLSSARIISGPGTLSQTQGGFFGLTGISTTETTRVEITRYYDHAPAYGNVWLYPDSLTGVRMGVGIKMSATSLLQTTYEGNFSTIANNLSNWTPYGLNTSSAGTINGAAAVKYTAQGNQFTAISAGFPVKAGESVTYAASFMAVSGSLTQQDIGLWDGTYGSSDDSVARIISGPGTIVQLGNGTWRIAGLSTTVATRFEITRTVRSDTNLTIYNFVDIGNWAAGQSLIVAAPSITRTPGSITSYKYDSLGRLRIKQDPLGTRNFYFYDKLGRKIGEVDGTGAVTEYKYDANDNLIATVAYATALTSAQITSLFDSYFGTPTNVDFASIRPSTNSADRWSWSTYDRQGRITASVDMAGAVTSFEYDGAGRLTTTHQYATALSAATVEGFKTTLPSSITLPSFYLWFDRTTRNFYDKDGFLTATLDAEGHLTEIFYDKAGRKIETLGWYSQTGTSAGYENQPAFWRNSTLAQLKASISPYGLDRHNYWIYDGRGLLAAAIDGEGNVTRYHYTARGQVIQEIRGQKVTANTSYTLSTLPAASGTLETTNYIYDALGQIITQVKLLSGGHSETTTYNYNNMGKLVSQSTSETVSIETRALNYRYDAKGRLVASLTGNGSAALAALGSTPTQAQIDTVYATYGVRYVYDAADHLIATYTPDGTGSTGNRTLHYYDNDGRLRYEINALGEVSEYRYNTLGDQTNTIVYGTRIAAGTLASLSGGLVTSAVTSAVGAIANASLDSKTSAIFDNRGLVAQAVDALNNTTYLTYTTFGQLNGEGLYVGGPGVWQTHTLNYTRRGQLANENWPAIYGQSGADPFSQNQYDAFGQMNFAFRNSWNVLVFNIDRAGRNVSQIDRMGGFSSATYDPRSNLIESFDRMNNKTTYSYDLFNRNLTTTTPEGITSSVKKNAYGQTILITDGENRTTSYSYDKNGNLKTVTDAAGTVTNTYDNADHLIETTDARGTKTTFTYDAVGRVLTRVQDAGSGKLNITTTYAYDAKGQKLSVTEAQGTAAQTVTQYNYDLKGQVLSVVADAGSGKLNLTTSYIYRADGKVLTMTEAVGTNVERLTSYVYDAIGRLLETHVDPNGLNLTTKNVYDSNSNIVAVTQGGAGSADTTVRFVYDKENRQILSVSAHGEVVETGYDAEGRAIWTRAYATQISQATIDGWNSASTWAITAAQATPAINASLDHVTRTLYDGDGRQAWSVDAEGYATRFLYDKANNLIKTIHYANAATTSNTTTKADLDTFFGWHGSPPSTAAVTTFGYDAANRLIWTNDAENNFENYQLDANGNRTVVTNKLGGFTGDYNTYYTYDALGRLTNEGQFMDLTPDDNSAATTFYYKNIYEYDALGRVTHQIEGYGRAERRDTWFAYDALGRRTSKTSDNVSAYNVANGSTQTVTPKETVKYDARGNVIEMLAESWNGATLVYSSRTLFYYDKADRKIADIDAMGTYRAYDYDAFGNLKAQRVYATSVSLPGSAGGTPPSAPSGEYRETTYVYDKDNRLIESKILDVRTGYWNGSSYVTNTGVTLSATQEYDAFGNMVRETDANGNATYHYYDKNGREVAKVDAEKYLTTWTRDGEGNVISETRYAGKVTITVTAATAVASLTSSAGTNSADRTTQFTYDRNGRRLTEKRLGVASASISETGAMTQATVDATIFYQYNGFGQVTQKIEANGDVVNYDYDAQGHLRFTLGATITDFNGTSQRLKTEYFYDSLGNLVKEQASGTVSTSDIRVTRYTYGAGGRLVSTQDAANNVTTLEYGANGLVVESRTTRLRSDGLTSVVDKQRTVHDLLGRAVEQYVTSVENGNTTYMPVTMTVYNAYGDVISTKMRNYADSAASAVTQAVFEYDKAGRVTKTNSGDGVWKFFVYDANGNATLTITSAGYDFAGTNLATALTLINDATVGATVNGTYAVYDKRNMVTQSVEEGRQLSSATPVNLISSRSYNAFGETLSETDALNNTTDYSYNSMGRMVQKRGATIQITLENNTTQWIRPTEDYYYDVSGRLVATRDANGSYTNGAEGAGGAKTVNTGNLTTQRLLAGTGHEEGGPLVVSVFNPDGGITNTGYDVFGNARVNQVKTGASTWRTTNQSFDAMGRVISVSMTNSGLVNEYSYDSLGQRLKSWNNYYGVYSAARTDYDSMGRVISEIAQGGDMTTTSYVWNSALVTTGLNSTADRFGGWVETKTYANYKTSSSSIDAFGRIVSKTDMGGHVSSYTYDKAGRLTQSTADYYTTSNYTWFNTGLSASVSAPSGTETYEYDKLGHRTKEYMTDMYGSVVKNASTTYNASGWMLTWVEAGSGGTLAASKTHTYDANGNIRSTLASNHALNAQGQSYGVPMQTSQWYRFDSMNRVVMDGGINYLYDVAGQRVQAYWAEQMSVVVQGGGYGGYQYGAYQAIGDGGGYGGSYTVYYTGQVVESYGYDGVGRLITVHEARSTAYEEVQGSGELVVVDPYLPGSLKGSYGYDLLGRQISQTDYSGSTVIYSRSANYDARNLVTSDDVSTKRFRTGTSGTTDIWRSVTTYNYGYGYSYALGAATSVTTINYKNNNNGDAPDTSTTNNYAWWDSAVLSSISYDSDTGSNSNPVYNTTYYYNGLGQMSSVYISDGRPRTVTYTNDVNGQGMRRDEADYNYSTGDPHEIWYRFAGKEMGYTGNNGNDDMRYTPSISDRQVATPTTPGPFRNGSTYGASSWDLAQGPETINSYHQASSYGTYTVNAGDSLTSIASSLWGDSGLWYKIAEANGISANTGLIAGQKLILPAGVMRNTHNANTNNPYDPAAFMGDTAPGAPKPNKGKKCGILGAILMSVIAIAVTVLTQGVAASFLGPVLGGMASATAGSLAGQVFGVAAGIQENINWKSVGISALSAGVTGGINAAFGSGAMFGSQFAGDVIRGAAGSAITQGVAVATGLQDKFSWSAVAAAGIGAGIGGAVTRGLSKNKGFFGDGKQSIEVGGKTITPTKGSWQWNGNATNDGFLGPNFGAQAASSAADILSQAATQSAIDGSNFGDNILASLPSALGNLIGRQLGQGLQDAFSKPAESVAAGKPKTAGDDATVVVEAEAADDAAQNNNASGDDEFCGITVQGLHVPEIRLRDEYGLTWLDRYKLTMAGLELMQLDNRRNQLTQQPGSLKKRLAALSEVDRKELLFEISGAKVRPGAQKSVPESEVVLGETEHLSAMGFGEGGRHWLGALIEDSNISGITLKELSTRLNDHIVQRDKNGDIIRTLSESEAIQNFVTSANDTQLSYGIDYLRQLADFGNGNAKMLLGAAVAEKQKRYDEVGRVAEEITNRTFLTIAAIGPVVGAALATAPASATIYGMGTTGFYTAAVSTGSTLGVTTEFVKNYALNEKGTWGGYISSGVFGGLGSTFSVIAAEGKYVTALAQSSGVSAERLAAIGNGFVFGVFGDSAKQGINLFTGEQTEINYTSPLTSGLFSSVGGAAFPRYSGVGAGEQLDIATYRAIFSTTGRAPIGADPWLTFRAAGTTQIPVIIGQSVISPTVEVSTKKALGY